MLRKSTYLDAETAVMFLELDEIQWFPALTS